MSAFEAGERGRRGVIVACASALLCLLTVAVYLGLGLVAPNPASGSSPPTTSQALAQSSGQSTPGNPNGADIYAKNCAGCHGPRGHGTNAGPSIKAAGSPVIVAPKVRTGGRGMPAFASVLTDQQIEAVAEYVADTRSDPTARGATEAEGAQAFFLYCASCHGSTGRGGAMTEGHNAPVLDNVNGGDVLMAFIQGPGEMPEFAGGTLTNRQMSAVALYVQEDVVTPPSPGGWGVGYRGPVHEGFFALFLGLGGLILLARWAQGDSRHGANV